MARKAQQLVGERLCLIVIAGLVSRVGGLPERMETRSGSAESARSLFWKVSCVWMARSADDHMAPAAGRPSLGAARIGR